MRSLTNGTSLRAMARAGTVLVLSMVLVASFPGGARAEDGGAAVADPDLQALKLAVEEFRVGLAALRETCGKQADKSADAATKPEECRAQYAKLRETSKALKHEALKLAHRLHEWTARAKEEGAKLAKDHEKEEGQKREHASMDGKSLEEKLRWFENRMLQDRVDVELFQQRAREIRQQAELLTGEKREEALRWAEKWEQKAADHAEKLKSNEAERQAHLTSGKDRLTDTVKDMVKKESRDEAAQHPTSVEKVQAMLRALDERMAQYRAELARVRAEGNLEMVAKLEKTLVQLELERVELLRQASTAKDKLRQELSAVDETLAFKRGEQTKSEALANSMRAAAERATGLARDEFLAKAAKYDSAARDWAAYVVKYELEKKRLLTAMDLVLR